MKVFFRFFGFALILFAATSCKVTFTGGLRTKIEAQGLDLKKIQYYNSKKILLRRILSTSETKVASGQVSLQNGLYVEEIYIKKNTPGVVDSIAPNALAIRFEQGKGRYIVFEQAAYGVYQMKADHWSSQNSGATPAGYAQFMELNRGEVLYDGKKYYTNTAMSRPKLKIKKTENSKYNKSSRKASGIKVE